MSHVQDTKIDARFIHQSLSAFTILLQLIMAKTEIIKKNQSLQSLPNGREVHECLYNRANKNNHQDELWRQKEPEDNEDQKVMLGKPIEPSPT